MVYRDFKGLKLSGLGMGNMRLPVVDGDDSKIDYAEAERIIDYAYEHGVNYFDTAYAYHNGSSELAVRQALSKYPRESYYLADKFPGYDLANMPKVKEIFEEQLQKCGVDYFDFYLFHNVCELNIEEYLDPKYGILDYLLEQKKLGRIKHLGFSCHGAMPVLKRFLDAYGEHMEFCQVQLNYLDWGFQDARAKVELLAEHGIPVWVMEPVRGGQLVNVSDEAKAAFAAVDPGMPPVEWALRWLFGIPQVTTILSGASSLEQMAQNIAIFDKEPLSGGQRAVVAEVAERMTRGDVLPCTACHYCTSHCPLELDIPHLLALYNEHKLTKGGFIAPMALAALPEDKQPASCIGCGSCSAVCPQQIDIPAALADFAEMLKA